MGMFTTMNAAREECENRLWNGGWIRGRCGTEIPDEANWDVVG